MKSKASRNLYFIEILQRALERPNRARAFKDAIDEIADMSGQAEYADGYENFLRFIEAVESHSRGALPPKADDDASLGLLHTTVAEIFDVSEEAAQDFLSVFEKEDAEAFVELARHSIEVAHRPMVEVLHGEEVLGSAHCDDASMPLLVRDVRPGSYSIRLSNGRELWSDVLRENQVRWSQAFPGKEYPAAAMSSPVEAEASVSDELLDGELSVEVIPGLELATIIVSLGGGRSSRK